MLFVRIQYSILKSLESFILELLCWTVLSEAVAVVCCCCAELKSILGVSPKVKDSIEDPFK
jgi:hypothetical protein